MALTKSAVKRTTVAAGDDFLVLEDGSNRRAQATGEVDETGDHLVFDKNFASVTPGQFGQIKVTAGSLGEVFTYLDPAGPLSAVCLMLFDQVASPINTTLPKWRIPLVQNQGGFSFPKGLVFTNGMWAVLSTTHTLLTIAGTGEGFIQARFR